MIATDNAAPDALHAYADGMREFSERMRRVELMTEHPDALDPASPLVAEICAEMYGATMEMMRLGAAAFTVLAFRTDCGPIGDEVHGFITNAWSSDTSMRWIGYIPGSGMPNDPYVFGFNNRREVLKAVREDVARQAAEAIAVAADVREYATRCGAR